MSDNNKGRVCGRCGAPLEESGSRHHHECKAFTGIPLVTVSLEGDVLHLRNDGSEPVLATGAVFGYRDDAGNFVAEGHAIHSVEVVRDAARLRDAARRALSDADNVIGHIARGNGRDDVRCRKCGALVIAGHSCVCAAIPELERDDAGSADSIRAQAARHDAFELALDPFERIELLAAELRNAYRALERGDRVAVLTHGSALSGHFIMLLRGLH